MAVEKLVEIYETTDVGRAEVIRAALDDAGIDCSVENSHQAGLTGVLPCKLFVLSGDEQRAREFIAAHEAVE